jgi:uncharacterized protein
MAKLLIIFFLILVIASLATFFLNRGNPPYTDGVIELANQKINIELADEIDEQINGLSNRVSIKDNEGMLFVYEKQHKPTFWMKGMEFSIDIIWILDNKVVDITADVQPEPGVPSSDLRHYSPKVSIDKVLEVNSSWARKNGLRIGDEVQIILD